MKYRTIVADPPWPTQYGKRQGWYYEGGAKSTPLPYSTMGLAEIGALPVKDLAAENARLFLWTTNGYLPNTFDVIGAWGFTYKQTLVWHKTNASPFSGTVAHSSAEFLLVATRGRVEVLRKMPSSVLSIGHHHDHARKPEAFLDFVEQVSPGPYLEMFARRGRLGWDYYGDESLQTVDLEGAA